MSPQRAKEEWGMGEKMLGVEQLRLVIDRYRRNRSNSDFALIIESHEAMRQENSSLRLRLAEAKGLIKPLSQICQKEKPSE
jgi:hypothetical protein